MKCCGTCRFYITKAISFDNGMPNAYTHYCRKNKELLINSGLSTCNYWRDSLIKLISKSQALEMLEDLQLHFGYKIDLDDDGMKDAVNILIEQGYVKE